MEREGDDLRGRERGGQKSQRQNTAAIHGPSTRTDLTPMFLWLKGSIYRQVVLWATAKVSAASLYPGLHR
jgi:hypothetical protein